MRITRRPLTAAIWLLLLTAGSLLFILGGSLLASALSLSNYINGQLTALAVTNLDWFSAPSDEQIEQLELLPQVEMADKRRFAAVYSEQFSPVLSAQAEHSYQADLDSPYNRVMFEVTVLDHETWDMDTAHIKDGHFRVENVLYAHSGYAIEKGQEIEFSWLFYYEEEDVPLEDGELYIVYGTYEANNLLYLPLTGELNDLTPMIKIDSEVFSGGGSNTDHWELYDSQEMPTIAKLDGSAEQFLDDPANALWKRAAEEWEVTAHSLPVFGTEALESVMQFQEKTAAITQGRSFSREEYKNGERVCILSEAVAAESGISVGDTISLTQYACSNRTTPEQEENLIGLYLPITNPYITIFDSRKGFASEAEEFTVIGLYRQDEWWNPEREYSFTPNTVFVPEKALPSEADTYSVNTGVFLSLKIYPGKTEEFREASKALEMDGTFFCLDQGYDQAEEGVRSMRESSCFLALTGAICQILVTVLFCLLYQGREKKNVGILRSLGETQRGVCWYLMKSALILGALGTVVGGLIAIVFDRRIQYIAVKNVLSGNEAVFSDLMDVMQKNVTLIPYLAIGQLLLFCFIVWIYSRRLARKQPMDLLRKENNG